MKTTCLSSINWGKGFSVLMLLMFVLVLALATTSAADSPRAHPALLKFAKERPNDKIHVIVQQYSKDKLTDRENADHGMKIGKKLDMINGFAAEMPLNKVEALAKNNKVRWVTIDAPVRASGGFGTYTFLDVFSSKAYGGSDGTQNWSANKWTEVGESDGASAGSVRVVAYSACATDNCLRIGASGTSIAGKGITRKAVMTAATSATLSFSYRRSISSNGGGSLGLAVSGDDGTTWQTLATYAMSVSDNNQVTQSFDISAYANDKTTIRFLGSGTANGYLYVDNVQIEYSRLANTYIMEMLADKWWKENSTPGQGVTVAVVDSGINAQHGDFLVGNTSRVTASVNKCSGCSTTADDNGHGTHIAGIIGGMGTLSNYARIGGAPLVNLVNVKVSDQQGRSYTSDVVSALQWVYDNRATYNIRVVNLSLNSTVPESYHTSPLSAAVEILWFNKIVVVVAAGNNGTDTAPVTLYPPANDPFVITVGSVDDKGTRAVSDDTMATFSAYGTTESSFAKPDLVTSGISLISPLASTSSYNYMNYPNNRVDSNYFRMGGTSVSAAVVSGAAALLLQDEPTLNPDQVKYRLKATANKTGWSGYNSAKAGAGLLDVYAAVKGTTTQTANTGIAASQLLFTGTDPAAWDAANWGSVDWGSVDWGSVDWGSVDWGSVDWGSWRP
ncbi:MAG: S8 family serine peptidase [Chloroflexi bacterium]|nr:S8 family serine peptidase [Chloroflexota bacterium]